MVKKIVIASVAVVALLIIGAPAMAHHSVAAEFDVKKELILTGTLTKFENVNPHTWWYIDVKEPDGKVTSWKLESLNPNGLIRQGLRAKSDLTIGQTYTFRVHPARRDPEGYRLGFMWAITVNGKEYVVIKL